MEIKIISKEKNRKNYFFSRKEKEKKESGNYFVSSGKFL